jgi:hypothetical protein
MAQIDVAYRAAYHSMAGRVGIRSIALTGLEIAMLDRKDGR